jgi:trans-aconitate methyltransferase
MRRPWGGFRPTPSGFSTSGCGNGFVMGLLAQSRPSTVVGVDPSSQAIAEAAYGVPDAIAAQALAHLPADLRAVVDRLDARLHPRGRQERPGTARRTTQP